MTSMRAGSSLDVSADFLSSSAPSTAGGSAVTARERSPAQVKPRFATTLAGLLAISVLLSACVTPPPPAPAPAPPPPVVVPPPPPPPPPPAPPAPPAPPTADEQARLDLAAGIAAYDDARYQQAGRLLNNAAQANLSQSEQIDAMKYLAFIAGAQGRKAECRSFFDRILAVRPDFDLTKGEAGHPTWGPIFRDAKRAALAKKK